MRADELVKKYVNDIIEYRNKEGLSSEDLERITNNCKVIIEGIVLSIMDFGIKSFDLLSEVYDLMEGPFDSIVINEELYNKIKSYVEYKRSLDK